MLNKICVPTYNRKNPKILKMLEKDKNLVLSFCVRGELLDSGFYDDFKNNPQIELLNLGYGLTNLGHTRQRIMQYCKDKKIKYVTMLDDTLDDIYDIIDMGKPISQILDEVIDRLENDPLKDLCVMYQFHRPERKRCISDKEHKKYFVCCPVQAFTINVDKAFEYGLTFKSYDEAGSEDEAFFVDTLKKGLITCSNTNVNISGDIAAVRKEGGTHESDDILENIADYRETKLAQYAGEMYGVYYTKRYRTNIGCLFSMATFDYDYFYDVLISRREQNKKIIDSEFKVVKRDVK